MRERADAARTAASTERRTAARAGLAVVTFAPEGGGVAYVARLLRRALGRAVDREPFTLSLEPARPGRVSTVEAVRFGARLVVANARRHADWFVFNHVGISDAQGRLPRFIRRPYAVQLHGTEAWDGSLGPGGLAALRRAELRIAPSAYTARRAAETYATLGPIAVCPHGLLPEEPNGALGAPDGALLAAVRPLSALIVARLWSTEGQKGHDQLIECWPLVIERAPGAQLVVAGGGDDLPRLRRKAADAGLGAGVLFTGYVSEATRDALLRTCAVFAMPSRQEGFGIAYLEAMRAGLPCVGATDDGASEPVVDGVTGLLVEQGDRSKLARAIGNLLCDAELRRRLGEAGRRRYAERFTFEHYERRLATLLEATFGGS